LIWVKEKDCPVRAAPVKIDAAPASRQNTALNTDSRRRARLITFPSVAASNVREKSTNDPQIEIFGLQRPSNHNLAILVRANRMC
jgi:hypothetical protein